jgi:hypothetical protein
LPTYRAAERTFELIAQAVGRSGRSSKTGEALIQTFNPSHYAIVYGARQDYEGFFQKEMQERKIAHYPPYVYLILLEFAAVNEDKCVQAAYDFKNEILSQGIEIPRSGGAFASVLLDGERQAQTDHAPQVQETGGGSCLSQIPLGQIFFDGWRGYCNQCRPLGLLVYVIINLR